MSVSVLGIRIGFTLIGMGLILLTVGAALRGFADSIGIVWYTLLIMGVGIGIGGGLVTLGLVDQVLPALASSNSTGVHWG